MAIFIQCRQLLISIQDCDPDGVVDIEISGKIHEGFGSDEIQSILDSPPLATARILNFSLREVKSINSIGIRNWVVFMAALAGKYAIRYSEVSEIVVETCYIVTEFLGDLRNPVLSVRLPYHCLKCGANSHHSCTRHQMTAATGEFRVPAIQCPSCSRPLEFGGIDEEYTKFFQIRG